MSFPYLYQLQDARFEELAALDFRIATLDMDDAGLDRRQVASLQDEGRTLLTYLSIGEAEEYRAYWDGLVEDRPDIVLDENPDWEGNHRVRFWEADWQAIVLDRIEEAVALGYDGAYLDIVDAYSVRSVRAAGSGRDLRGEMVEFVQAISQHAEALDPDFLIVPQNAVELLARRDDEDRPNRGYLDAIDGVGVEDLWFDDDRRSDWTAGDLALIRHAQEAGRFVLATSYPTERAKREAFAEDAIAEGLVPFVGRRALDDRIPAVNEGIDELVGGRDLNLPEAGPRLIQGGRGHDVLIGGPRDDRIEGGRAGDVLKGRGGDDRLDGGGGWDTLRGGGGDDVLTGGRGHDRLDGGAGRDALRGGTKRDTLVFDAADEAVRGGRGHDALLLEAADHFDFGHAALRSIEALDLANGGRDTVGADASDIERRSGRDSLRIAGDAGDRVTSDLSRRLGTVEEDGTEFALFRGGGVERLVELGLSMNGELLV